MAERLPFPNPEVAWHSERHGQGQAIVLPADDMGRVDGRETSTMESDAHLVLSRIPTAKAATLLTGGLANTSIRVDQDCVLRIYQRDVTVLPLERQLLNWNWQRFQTPRVLEEGDDFLVIEFLPHRPLENTHPHGHAVGAALAEIHQLQYDQCGDLDRSAALLPNTRNQPAQPWENFLDEIEQYLAAALGEPEEGSHESGWGARMKSKKSLIRQCISWFQKQRGLLAPECDQPVLLHGDFKASNLHWSTDDCLLVLDWEFAYAGPALMDIGQLFRWGASDAFRSGFAVGYQEHRGELCADWETKSTCFDLVNLVGLLKKARSGSQQETDCWGRIERTLRLSAT